MRPPLAAGSSPVAALPPLPTILTSKKTLGLPGRSRRSTMARAAACSAKTIASDSALVNTAPEIHGTLSPLERTIGSSFAVSTPVDPPPFLPQHSPCFCPLQPPASGQKTHTRHPTFPAASCFARFDLHKAQQSAALSTIFCGPQMVTCPSYSVCGRV